MTQCPYAFELALCFLSSFSGGEDMFSTAEGKYYSSYAKRHLSTLCRMENDYGSVTRDRCERQVNSVDFPEFFPPETRMGNGLDVNSAKKLEKEQKAILLKVAQYERESYNDALRRMDKLVEGDAKRVRLMQLLRVMTNVTDSWGQMVTQPSFSDEPAGQALI
jgi:hypothetical protein